MAQQLEFFANLRGALVELCQEPGVRPDSGERGKAEAKRAGLVERKIYTQRVSVLIKTLRNY